MPAGPSNPRASVARTMPRQAVAVPDCRRVDACSRCHPVSPRSRSGLSDGGNELTLRASQWWISGPRRNLDHPANPPELPTKEGGGRRSSPAAQDTFTRITRCYLLQHPEPQLPSCSACTPAVGHSSSQQTQVQLMHSHLPVSQQPQQSHALQPARWPLRVAGTMDTKASAAMRNRLFMGRILCLET